MPAFALAMILVELTPGPNLTYLALLGASNGRRAGLLAVAGITVGLLFWLFVALFGLTRTPLHSPEALDVLRWVSAAYLLWLAWEALRSGSGATADEKPARAGPFVRGLAANMLNPKAAIFYLALLPGFIEPEAGPLVTQILVLGGLHIAISIVIHSAAVFGAAGAASSLPPRWAYGLRVFLAISLVAAAFLMVVIPLAPG
ncbi:LysE family translocator [Brevundimonas basaltis]|uniref:Threonine/homoserine/homoserine lactone efflux protein n=1 Tax=Brevundimonas basaltis TaxID=472166 RepID=A0A7W8HY51_9CAUL|nr:LysE family translocator [Brevundimonas basaltis]MBB5291092.1 threonine/homoserine/homoserine lactone efflux protein [Brevundimonas basaltis]